MLDEVGSTAAGVIAFACAIFILSLGTRLTVVADRLADRTGWGEALTGGILLGASTSLPGVVLSITAAAQGHPELAMTNAVGGIAAQTFFLAIADLAYRRANLEHAAASLANMMQTGVLLMLLLLIALAPLLPNQSVFGVHPLTPVLVLVYGWGMRLVSRVNDFPMWRPALTRETRRDVPEDSETLPSLRQLWVQFVPLAISLAFCGWVLEAAASRLVATTSLTETGAGLLLTSVATSLPELVTSIAAVRRGALTLAVGGILGGNAFDTLFCAASDVSYRSGSVYHAASDHLMTWVLLTALMSSVLLVGLLRRQERGIARIGTESALIIVLYGVGVLLVWQ